MMINILLIDSPRETGEVFLDICPNNKRDAETLESIILKRVRPGTHILTDCWRAYTNLLALGEFKKKEGFLLLN